MKKLSHLLLVFLVSVVVFSCSKKPDEPVVPPEDTSVPAISNLSRDVPSPEPGQPVVVSATITTPETAPLTSTVLKYKVNDGNPSNVTMSNGGSGNVYSGTIPAQSVDGATVDYTVTAANKNGSAEEKSGSYVVSSTPIDYTQLALNEINGNGIDYEKYIELYNNSSRAIPLHGVTIYYNNFDSEPEVTWTGASQVIQPKSFLLLQGTKIDDGDLKTGLSATKGIVVEMFDPDENSIDLFYIGEDPNRKNSYSRLPDGTGKWYLTFEGGTPGQSNGINYGSDPIPTSPVIFGFTRDVDVPAADNAVEISATVRTFPGTTLRSVVLKWTLDGAAQPDVAMTNSEGYLYSATIPAQAAGSLVEYTLTATNDEGETTEVSSGYFIMPDGDIDYSKLKLNEVSGVGADKDKFYELINTGDEFIPLAGCKIYYNANALPGGIFPPNGNQGLTWTGNALQFVRAGELFCLVGSKGGAFSTGLTAERILYITLTDPEGNVIDECIRAEDTGDYSISDKSFSRIPDGTGPFYFTTPTPCVMNGNDATGLLLVPQEPVEPEPSDADYTKLKLNEVSGVGDSDCDKFYELINLGDVDIPLKGCKIYYNANSSNGGILPGGKGNLTWTGLESQVANAGALFSLIGRNGGNCTNPPTPGSFTTGLTAQRILIITLEDPAGNLIDQCIRAEDTGDYAITDKSFSRIPDGTGPFYFTEPTPDVMNGNDASGLLLVPVTQGELPIADYTNLRINEVNGVSGQKWVEIYNMGDEAVPLAGVTINYSNNAGSTFSVQWTFAVGDVITANDFFSNSTALGSCSANNANVIITLKSPSGEVIDTYTKLLNINTGQGYDDLTDKAHARIPDGTGDWYYTADGVGTRNATNGTSTEGLTKFGEEIKKIEEIEDGDYSDLVLNEVDGNSKAIELYNKGTEAIPLTGVTLWKNETGSAWWTGSTASGSIAPDSYVLIVQTGQRPGGDVAGLVGANGISAGQTVKFELKDPSDNSLGVFERGGPTWSQSISSVAPNSFQRIPNGTGDWKQAEPTNGAVNASTGSDIPQN